MSYLFRGEFQGIAADGNRVFIVINGQLTALPVL